MSTSGERTYSECPLQVERHDQLSRLEETSRMSISGCQICGWLPRNGRYIRSIHFRVQEKFRIPTIGHRMPSECPPKMGRHIQNVLFRLEGTTSCPPKHPECPYQDDRHADDYLGMKGIFGVFTSGCKTYSEYPFQSVGSIQNVHLRWEDTFRMSTSQWRTHVRWLRRNERCIRSVHFGVGHI